MFVQKSNNHRGIQIQEQNTSNSENIAGTQYGLLGCEDLFKSKKEKVRKQISINNVFPS